MAGLLVPLEQKYDVVRPVGGLGKRCSHAVLGPRLIRSSLSEPDRGCAYASHHGVADFLLAVDASIFSSLYARQINLRPKRGETSRRRSQWQRQEAIQLLLD